MNKKRQKPSSIFIVILIILGINLFMDTGALNVNFSNIIVFIFMFSLIPYVIKAIQKKQNTTNDNETHREYRSYQGEQLGNRKEKEYACDYCGDMVPENSEYCPHCGAAQLPN